MAASISRLGYRKTTMGTLDNNHLDGEADPGEPIVANAASVDYSATYPADDGARGAESPIHVSRESIQRAGYQVFGGQSELTGMSDIGQAGLALCGRGAARFPFTLGERRTRRNDLWYRFLSLAASGQTMPDLEFVEMVLYTTGRIKDCKSLASKLLDRFQSLAGVFNAELYQLADLGPIDQNIFNAFRAVRGVAGHLARQEIGEKPVITNWDKLLVYLRATMAHKNVEQFRALFLDRNNVLLADEMQNEGTIDHTPVYPREVVKRALILDATAVIMVHNHPSNQFKPSKPDIEMTMRIKSALDGVGILLHDHVIVSRGGHTSFRMLGLL